MKTKNNKLKCNYENLFIYNDEKFIVNLRTLWELLDKPQGKFTDLINRKVTNIFKNNVDYKHKIITKQSIRSDGQKGVYNQNEYYSTIDLAIKLCKDNLRNDHAIEILNLLLKYKDDNRELIVIKQPRLEFQFGDMLDKLTNLKFTRQYSIDNNKYRLDFYLENILIIEYDEEHHSRQLEKDHERMEYCRGWIANKNNASILCPVIRVKKNEELEGINRIIKYLTLVGYINNNDSINDLCDYF